MIDVFPFAGLPVAVFGLDEAGRAAARSLQYAEAEVWAWDDAEPARMRAKADEIPLVDLYLADWRKLTSLVIAPGVSYDADNPHPVVTLAREAGCEVITDTELLVRTQRDAGFIGIAGYAGKSITTALLGHILLLSGREAEIGGDGVPVLGLHPLGSDGVYVLEMSPLDLELTVSPTFDVGVLLNHSEHASEADISNSKSVFQRQTKPRTAVIGIDDAASEAIYKDLKSRAEQNVIAVSAEGCIKGGIYVEAGVLYDDTEGTALPITNLRDIQSLPGRHNWQNAACAYAAARAAGVESRVAMACIQSFPGLVHRQEIVDVVDAIAYVNDSWSRTMDAVAKSVECYEAVYWIGGVIDDDPASWQALELHLKRLRHAFVISDGEDIPGYPFADAVAMTPVKDVAAAVAAARLLALEEKDIEGVVLLSPGTASLPGCGDYKALGEAFRDVVEQLPGDHEDAA